MKNDAYYGWQVFTIQYFGVDEHGYAGYLSGAIKWADDHSSGHGGIMKHPENKNYIKIYIGETEVASQLWDEKFDVCTYWEPREWKIL